MHVLCILTSCTCSLGCTGLGDQQTVDIPLAQAENLILTTQQQQNLESLRQLVHNHLQQQQEEDDHSEILQQLRQGHGDVIARNDWRHGDRAEFKALLISVVFNKRAKMSSTK